MKVLQLAVIWTTYIVCSESANILAFPTFPGYSHFIIIEPLLKALASRGHNVTVVSYFPQKIPVKNYHDIDVSHTLPLVTNNITVDYCLKNMRSPTDFMQFVYNIGYKTCIAVFKEKQVQDMINSTSEFDLVITELFGSDCFTAFAYKYKLPLISIVTTIGVPWAYQRIANPDNPSYITNYFLPVKEKMTLYDRFINTVIMLLANIGYYFMSDIPSYELTKMYFGESLPPLYDIYKNTSIILTNSHYSFRQIQPFLPNLIEIGGIHLKDPKPLPKDLQEVLDKSSQGVILLTLGSMLRCSSLPDHIIKAFIKTFEKLPYLVLWKVEDELPSLPPNVITKKWLPVKDVLAHPNLKLLIMHGGMATTIEAINAGVPVVGIPMYADQPGNINSLVNKGAAIGIDYFDINEEKFYNAVTKVITDPSYSENAKKLSKLFKDRENTPLETAIYWTEYVLRHKGALHLKSPAVDLPWYQLALLDVIFVFFILMLTIFSLIYIILRAVRNYLFRPIIKKYKNE
ncbi:UDP-glycosyltransferase UGT5-like isoform X4 [Lycorma delicatula]|uniref:UDP-glycosyltransferase UGT5-like isoform X2 n=1 Tax=Lycorma delicatula TaxID=130591 RepID=UPI003F512433